MNGIAILNGSRSQKTFAISVLLVAIIGLAQLIAAVVLSTRRARNLEAELTQPIFLDSAAPGTASTHVTPFPTSSPQHMAMPSRRELGQLPGSVPDTLLRVARGLRERGDTTNAIAKLQQATALDPQNPDILAELALTYESMQFFDRSNETWRRLQSLGAAAGPLYDLAKLKLQVGVQTPANPISAAVSPAAAAASPAETTAIPDGSVFGISEVNPATENDPEAETKLRLRVGVKRRPDVAVDHTKVKIQVFFYDVVDNDQVALTDAEVNYEWITPGHNWTDTDTEVLDVTYFRPKTSSTSPASVPVPDSVEKAQRAGKKGVPHETLPTNEGSQRTYLGYIVRVYYKDQLQAVRADPTRLLNLFPPPFTAPPQ